MKHTDLTEVKIESEAVYDGVLLHVRRDQVRLPDGGSGVREYIVHPGAVGIVPLTDDGELLLERQFRYPLQRVMIEIPAGKIDAGESTLATGKRELLEETGYVAERWDFLATIHPLCAYSDEHIELWLARGLRHEGANLDDGEFLEVFTLPVAQALEWVRDGRITDVKTIIAINWAEKILAGQWQPPRAG